MIFTRTEDLILLKKYNYKMLESFGKILTIFDPKLTSNDILILFKEFINPFVESVKYYSINENEYDLVQETIRSLTVSFYNILEAAQQKQEQQFLKIHVFCQHFNTVEKYLNNMLFQEIKKIKTEDNNISPQSFINDEDEDDDPNEMQKSIYIPILNTNGSTQHIVYYFNSVKEFLESLSDNLIQTNDYDIQFINQFYTQFSEFYIILPTEILVPTAQKVNIKKPDTVQRMDTPKKEQASETVKSVNKEEIVIKKVESKNKKSTNT